MGTSKQFCTFRLKDFFFGIEVTNIQEVIKHQEMTPVPLAPAVVQGLINLRGQIVTALDLRARLELPPREGGELPLNVVVRTEDGAVSLLVDDIGDVLEIDDSTFERPPETLDGVARELVEGVYKMKGSLLMVLNTAKTVNFSGPAR